jgi:hypothetical protein
LTALTTLSGQLGLSMRYLLETTANEHYWFKHIGWCGWAGWRLCH